MLGFHISATWLTNVGVYTSEVHTHFRWRRVSEIKMKQSQSGTITCARSSSSSGIRYLRFQYVLLIKSHELEELFCAAKLCGTPCVTLGRE